MACRAVDLTLIIAKSIFFPFCLIPLHYVPVPAGIFSLSWLISKFLCCFHKALSLFFSRSLGKQSESHVVRHPLCFYVDDVGKRSIKGGTEVKMTDRSLLPLLPTNSEELWEPLPFLNREKNLEMNNIKMSCFCGNRDRRIAKCVSMHCWVNKQHWEQQRKTPHWHVSKTRLTSVSCILLYFLQPPPAMLLPATVLFSHFVFHYWTPNTTIDLFARHKCRKPIENPD